MISNCRRPITILTADRPNGREHHVQPDCEEDLWSMAERLQHHLEGSRGTNRDINDYYRELLRLSDL